MLLLQHRGRKRLQLDPFSSGPGFCAQGTSCLHARLHGMDCAMLPARHVRNSNSGGTGAQGSSFLTMGLFWRGFLATCTTTVVLHILAFFKVCAHSGRWCVPVERRLHCWCGPPGRSHSAASTFSYTGRSFL